MGPRSLVVLAPVVVLFVASCSAGGMNTGGDSGRHDGSSDAHNGDGSTHDTGPAVCVDTDMDGISDNLEHHLMPGVTGDADDEDGDGFSDLIEGNRSYPGFSAMRPPLNCGTPDDCDSDGIYNFQDLDSDNDGLTDAEERAHMTNPCASDTDGDGIDDLTEVAAGSDPTSSGSMPPAGSLYVVLPYHDPAGPPGDHVHQQFTFATRIQQADVFILVDNSASMGPIINNLRSNLSSVIVPGVHAAIPDARFGIGSFDSVPDGIDGDSGSPGDYTLWVRQKLDPNSALSQNALNTMTTIDMSTGGGFVGGDYPEDQVEAIEEIINGDGMSGHTSDAAARRSVHNGLDASGDGYVPMMNPATDCAVGPDSPPTFGWGCFEEGRVPIVVLCSDASWYNGYAGSVFGGTSDPNQHSSASLTAAMHAHSAFYVGVDVGTTMDTYNNSVQLAMLTGTVDAMGHPIAFNVGGNISMASTQIVNAIATIAGQTRQDITTHVTGDPMETRLMAPHTTADFIKAVTPDHGIPDAPTGYDHHDATTFYNVAPSTQVVFDVDFYNDFQPGGSSAQLFQAVIHVLGRAMSEVDHRNVYIIVPAAGGGVIG